MGSTFLSALISIDGGRLERGDITVENEGGRSSWNGQVQGLHDVGGTVRVVALADGAAYFGTALLTAAHMPEYGDGQPYSEFMGNGELHRRDVGVLTDLLFASRGE
jgi:hypothetical protein